MKLVHSVTSRPGGDTILATVADGNRELVRLCLAKGCEIHLVSLLSSLSQRGLIDGDALNSALLLGINGGGA